MEVANKRLFFLYAHPCGDVLVRRGRMKEETLRRIREKLRGGGEVDEDPRLFRVAYAFLKIIASEKGKGEIDEEVIHEYYWRKHDGYVMEQAKEREDIVENLCRVFPGRVVEVNGGEAVVELPVGRRKVNIEFLPNLHLGDFVTVHYSYACERIDGRTFRKLWGEKNG